MGDFGCGDVGWTPFMKINGNKVEINPRINSLLIQENVKKRQRGWAKSAGFPWKTSRGACLSSPRGSLEQTFTYILLKISKICLGMRIDNQLRFIVIKKQADSLHSLITDGKYRNTSVGRNTWKLLIGSQVSLQPNCNKGRIQCGSRQPQSFQSKNRHHC